MQKRFSSWKTISLISLALVVFVLAAAVGSADAVLTPKQQLGKMLFFDTNLSNPIGMSCSSCHLPRAGFAEPDQNLPVSAGIVPGKFGGRNAPSAAYAAFSPYFHLDAATGLYIGGQFWDGRAATLADQAKGPFLNPVEMHATKLWVVTQVKNSTYATLFTDVFGPNAFATTFGAYNKIAEAIADYEGTSEVCQFSSKFDAVMAKRATFTWAESRGKALFTSTTKGKCANCHTITRGPNGQPPLFTDFTYDNLGVPSNPQVLKLINNPAFVDFGLGGILGIATENGKMKVPTLRNITLTAPYTHNGYFKDLLSLVHFYNTRDTLPTCGGTTVTPGVDCWPAPEVAANVNNTEMGNLGLTPAEERQIVEFLKTLADGYFIP